MEAVRAGGRGLVGAMAMTGVRRLTTSLGLVDRTPPEEVVSAAVPRLARTAPLPDEAFIELAHWTYGAAAGSAYGLLPERFRRRRLAGPVYGLSTWLAFELAVAPALGIRVAPRRTVSTRLMLAADHVLYGVIVAGQLPGDRSRR